jgi:hypothetical protein
MIAPLDHGCPPDLPEFSFIRLPITPPPWVAWVSEPLVECWIARVEAIEQRALIKLGTSQVSIRPVSREFLELEHFDGHRVLVSRDILIGMG